MAVLLSVEPVELLPVVAEPEVPLEEPEVPPELPVVEPVELPVDEGLVVEDGEPEDVPAALSVLRLQPPTVSTAANATASMMADLMLDAYISAPF